MKKLVQIIVLLLAPTLLWAHPVHLTVTNVDINTQTGKGTVFFKVFATDLQDALSLSKGIHLSINDILFDDTKMQWIHDYISSNFSISTSKKLNLNFNEHKTDDEHILLYYSFFFETDSKRMELFNSLLIDLLPDQSNLVILTIDGKDNGHTLNQSNKLVSFELK
jgi:hypothetical protein